MDILKAYLPSEVVCYTKEEYTALVKDIATKGFDVLEDEDPVSLDCPFKVELLYNPRHKMCVVANIKTCK